MITGVRIGELSDSEIHAIRTAFHKYAVLVFPGQSPNAEEQFRFALHFGNIEHLTNDRTQKVTLVSNCGLNDEPIDRQHHDSRILDGNELWHTDSSYMPVSATASVLTALTVPESGGETQWADMCATYDVLDPTMRHKISNLAAYHSLFHGQAQVGHRAEPGSGYGFYVGDRPLRPLVKLHPVTSRPALFIGRHAHDIPGLSESASRELIATLTELACQPPRVFTHGWNVGDTVIWDNRCVLHRARPYNRRQIRVLQHTRIAGDPRSELAIGMIPQQHYA